MTALEQLARQTTERMTGRPIEQYVDGSPVASADIGGIVTIIETLVAGIMSLMGKWQEVGCRQPAEMDPDAPITGTGDEVIAMARHIQQYPILNISRRIALTRMLRDSADTYGMSRRDVVKAREALLDEVVVESNRDLVRSAADEATQEDYGWI